MVEPRSVGGGVRGRIGRGMGKLLADGAHGEGFAGILGPLGKFALTEVVFVVEEQFVEAGAGDVDQAELGLAGGRGGTAALGDVLAAAAGGLHHLVGGARAGIHEARAERHGAVVDERGGLETAKIAVAAAGSQALLFGRSVG